MFVGLRIGLKRETNPTKEADGVGSEGEQKRHGETRLPRWQTVDVDPAAREPPDTVEIGESASKDGRDK